MTNNGVNSGIDAQTGFALQRNCALYLLLNNFDFYKDKNFFISIEHLDDFLFAFTSEDFKTLDEIHTYQSKKKSGSIWTINKETSEIITKILAVGNEVNNDSMPKNQEFSKRLIFISNQEMKLVYTPSKEQKAQGKKTKTVKVNETNEIYSYRALPIEIKDKINDNLNNFDKKSTMMLHLSEIDTLEFQWVDLPRKVSYQKGILTEVMAEKFPHIHDSKASVEILLKLFEQVELKYNQNNQTRLMDESKRLYSSDLLKTLEIAETHQLTFDKWRKHAEELSDYFQIPYNIQQEAKHNIREVFEYLKDMNNLEHLLIRNFISNNDFRNNHFNFIGVINNYVKEVKKQLTLRLGDVDIFFTSLCAYVECYEKETEQ